MMYSAMTNHTARFAQASCAGSVCSENNAIIMILDAIKASIFALISIRLLMAKAIRSLTTCLSIPYVA